MAFLSNNEIRIALCQDPPLVSDLLCTSADAGPDGPLEACAVKLRVGRIFLHRNNTATETQQAVLRQGEMAFILTKETLTLPDNMGGLMFPKSGGIAERGILITNTGHIDPGYGGKLRYAVINMGRESFSLRVGDYLVKVLFFELSESANPSWDKLHKPLGDPSASSLRALGRDFAAIESRMKDVAKSAVNRQFLSLGLLTLLLTAAATFIVGVMSFFLAFLPIVESRVTDAIEDQLRQSQAISIAPVAPERPQSQISPVAPAAPERPVEPKSSD